MNLLSTAEIKNLLGKHGKLPNKRLGQNFLIDKNVLDKIIKTAELKPDNTVLEVGPGIGTLTQGLTKHAKKVVAVEKDKTMCAILKETMAGCKNIDILQGDILKIQNSDFIRNSELEIRNYKVVANIPYYITSPVIRKFLESENKPEFMVLMIQKEVAQRICSKPPDMSLLSVSVQFYAEPKIVSYVSKNCFWPAPKVDSAIIKITPKPETRNPKSETNSKFEIQNSKFFKIVKAGFSQPRKQIAGNLSKILKLSREETAEWLKQNNIDPKQRAETLSVQNWQNLVKTVDNSAVLKP